MFESLPFDHTKEAPPESQLEKEFHLKEQYKDQIRVLNETGVLELLPDTESLGILGIDGKEYPLPSYDSIRTSLEAHKEFFETKKAQGFEKLLLVPQGMPLSLLCDRMKREILKKHKEGNLKSTEGTPLELDEKEPLSIWDNYKDADTNGSLVYFPESLTNDHKGKTKQALIDEGQAWDVVFIEDLPNLPAEGKGEIRGEEGKERKQIEANKSPTEYLTMMQDNPEYHGESGTTPELWITYFVTELHRKNYVIDDWQGGGKASYQTGAYFPDSSVVPYCYWPRVNRQVYMVGYDVGCGGSGIASRFSVRVFRP